MISKIDIVTELAAKFATKVPIMTGTIILTYPVISNTIIATDTVFVTAPPNAAPPTIA
jgi:hypothetical protein